MDDSSKDNNETTRVKEMEGVVLAADVEWECSSQDDDEEEEYYDELKDLLSQRRDHQKKRKRSDLGRKCLLFFSGTVALLALLVVIIAWVRCIQHDDGHNNAHENRDYNKNEGGGGVNANNLAIPSLNVAQDYDNDHVNLETIPVDGASMLSTPRSLLDFAIVGFPKSGTTFLKNWLRGIPELNLNPHEVCLMSKNKSQQAIATFANVSHVVETTTTPGELQGRPRVVGLKCPKDLETEWGLFNYARYFPQTKFVITTRHPVLWFQSFYNFRTYQRYPTVMPPPHQLVGPCRESSPYICPTQCNSGNQNVCTDRSNFHHALARLGKTPMNTSDELSFFPPDFLASINNMTPKSTARVFLMELNQLSTTNEASQRLSRDLGNFLEVPLPALRPYSRKNKHPNATKRAGFLDICNDDYGDLRALLVENGRKASTWILNYFLDSPDVVVSSREKIAALLEGWRHDPCLEGEKGHRYA